MWQHADSAKSLPPGVSAAAHRAVRTFWGALPSHARGPNFRGACRIKTASGETQKIAPKKIMMANGADLEGVADNTELM